MTEGGVCLYTASGEVLWRISEFPIAVSTFPNFGQDAFQELSPTSTLGIQLKIYNLKKSSHYF